MKPLDKDTWVAYMSIKHLHLKKKHAFKQQYEDLKLCANPDMNEKAFMAAYEEVFLGDEK